MVEARAVDEHNGGIQCGILGLTARHHRVLPDSSSPRYCDHNSSENVSQDEEKTPRFVRVSPYQSLERLCF